MSHARLVLDGGSLSLKDVERALGPSPPTIALAPSARRALREGRAAVERVLAEGRTVYGVNTGFGRLCEVRIPPEGLKRLQRDLILSHAAGVGPDLAEPDCRLAWLLKLNGFATGLSGVRPELAEMLRTLLEHRVTPLAPAQGSVGASGDLAPLAHMALVLLGRGRAYVNGRAIAGARALRRAGLRPMVLAPKEGLALINGTQMLTAVATRAFQDLERLAAGADVVMAMSLEALLGTDAALDEALQRVRRHEHQATVAARVRSLMRGSALRESHRDCGRVQDAYALRCTPQVHGAVRDSLEHGRRVLERELNAVTDNPIVFTRPDRFLSGGNFHGAAVGLVADQLAIAAAELGSISERRLDRLMNPDLNQGLPAFLAAHPGRESGLMLTQVTAAALVSENKVHCHPASVDSIPTSANQEDHVSMGMHAAVKLRRVVENLRLVLGIELLAAARALDLRPLPPGRGVAAAHAAVRERIRPLDRDREPAPDIQIAAGLLSDGSLLSACEGMLE